MKILVLNCGSSSIKYKLYNMDDNSVLAAGGVERIGLDEAFIKITLPNGEKKKIMHDMPDHKEGVNFVFQCLLDPEFGAIKSLSEIDAVGHRIVQGGDLFEKSVIVDKSVEDGIESLCDLAPVHNAGHLKGLRAVDKLMPEVPQVCVFDNAFHSTMPDYAYLYAVPYELYEKYHVRRYGFHGTSHRFVSARCCELLGRTEGTKIIVCHLGNGSSLSAVVDGKCVDTSMGLTPLQGVVMGTRSGDVDPACLQYIMNNTKNDDGTPITIDQMLNILNKKSGLLGLSEKSSDMRDVMKAAAEGDEQCALTIDIWAYSIRKYIGAYVAAMGGLDALVFTAGVGENNDVLREKICEGLDWMGIKIDHEKDKGKRTECEVSAADSRVKIFVIPTNEELAIARDTLSLVTPGK